MHIKLYIARKEKRLKQKDLADKLAIHPVTYSRKERGELDFTLTEAFILSDFFNIPIQELFNNPLSSLKEPSHYQDSKVFG